MRAEAWNMLELVRNVNQKLPAEYCDSEERLISIIERMEPKILKTTFSSHDFQLPTIVAPGGPLEVFYQVPLSF